MNSAPLSQSRPSSAKGSSARMVSIASTTHRFALFFNAFGSVQPQRTSVRVSVKANSPELFPPSWLTRSTWAKPIWASSQSANVRIGI